MKLTLKDRVLLLNTVLPKYDSREGLKLSLTITTLLKATTEENEQIVINSLGNGQVEVAFKTVDAITEEKEFVLSDDMLLYLKQRVNFLDRQGMFSSDTIETYDKILDTPFTSEEYTNKWKTYIGEAIDDNIGKSE